MLLACSKCLPFAVTVSMINEHEQALTCFWLCCSQYKRSVELQLGSTRVGCLTHKVISFIMLNHIS